MRSIANGSVEGFPDPATVRTVFVEADILGELSHLSCLEYIMQDPRYSLHALSRQNLTQRNLQNLTITCHDSIQAC
jgi:elongation factor 3